MGILKTAKLADVVEKNAKRLPILKMVEMGETFSTLFHSFIIDETRVFATYRKSTVFRRRPEEYALDLVECTQKM